MSQPNGIADDVGQNTPSDIDETLRFSGPPGQTQQAATGPSRPVASQSVAAASSAAPAGSASTVAQLEENILRRLMEQLQQMGIQQPQQQPAPRSSTTVAQAQPQPRPTANDDDDDDQPEEEDPWSNWQTRQAAAAAAAAPIGNQGQTSDNTWNTSDNKWNWDWTTNGKQRFMGYANMVEK